MSSMYVDDRRFYPPISVPIDLLDYRPAVTAYAVVSGIYPDHLVASALGLTTVGSLSATPWFLSRCNVSRPPGRADDSGAKTGRSEP